jgi:hypothetical protein
MSNRFREGKYPPDGKGLLEESRRHGPRNRMKISFVKDGHSSLNLNISMGFR